MACGFVIEPATTYPSCKMANRRSIYLSKDNEAKLKLRFGGAGELNYTQAVNTALAEWNPNPASAPEEGINHEKTETDHQSKQR